MTIIRGSRAIARYMGWKSHTTVLRNIEKYPPGSPYAHLNLPVTIFRVNRRPGYEFGADTVLLTEWMRRRSKWTADDELIRFKYRRRQQQTNPNRKLSKIALRKQAHRQQMNQRDEPQKSVATMPKGECSLHESDRERESYAKHTDQNYVVPDAQHKMPAKPKPDDHFDDYTGNPEIDGTEDY